jgi:VIT1/CCC1 family predicted Fe2+/Mn2+ transporter
MTPERMAALVARWVRFYTRNLPAALAQRRIEEIDADLHDHIADGRAHGSGDRRIALGILSRMVRGLAADVSWRGRRMRRSTVRIGLAAAFGLSLPLLAMQVTDQVDWRVADFVLAGMLLVGTGLTLSLIVRKTPNRVYRAAVGVAIAAALLLVWVGAPSASSGRTATRPT